MLSIIGKYQTVNENITYFKTRSELITDIYSKLKMQHCKENNIAVKKKIMYLISETHSNKFGSILLLKHQISQSRYSIIVISININNIEDIVPFVGKIRENVQRHTE